VDVVEVDADDGMRGRDFVALSHQRDQIVDHGLSRRRVVEIDRAVGYVAKNNPEAFNQALDRKLLEARPLYQINENAKLSQDGTPDRDSRIAQQIGRQYCLPVFLKTFGSDVAYATEQDGDEVQVYVSKEMTRRMAQLPDISGAAWIRR